MERHWSVHFVWYRSVSGCSLYYTLINMWLRVLCIDRNNEYSYHYGHVFCMYIGQSGSLCVIAFTSLLHRMQGTKPLVCCLVTENCKHFVDINRRISIFLITHYPHYILFTRYYLCRSTVNQETPRIEKKGLLGMRENSMI